MSSVVEIGIAHINSLHSAGQHRECVVTFRLQSNTEALSVRRMLRSKVKSRAVNCTTGVVKEMMSNLARRVMVTDRRDSTMLHDVSIQSLGYG